MNTTGNVNAQATKALPGIEKAKTHHIGPHEGVEGHSFKFGNVKPENTGASLDIKA